MKQIGKLIAALTLATLITPSVFSQTSVRDLDLVCSGELKLTKMNRGDSQPSVEVRQVTAERYKFRGGDRIYKGMSDDGKSTIERTVSCKWDETLITCSDIPIFSNNIRNQQGFFRIDRGTGQLTDRSMWEFISGNWHSAEMSAKCAIASEKKLF